MGSERLNDFRNMPRTIIAVARLGLRRILVYTQLVAFTDRVI